MNPSPPMHVLLVEDSQTDAVLIQGVLAQLPENPFQVTHVGSLGEAVEALQTPRVDVVLLDLSLPDSFGLETCQRILAASPATPVVIVTGQADDETALAAVQQGAQDFLLKNNLDGPTIARALRHAIERQRTRTELQRREATLGLIANEVPAIVWTTDSSLRFTSSLGAGLALLGLKPNEVVGLTLQEYFDTYDESSAVIKAHLRALEGESVQFETRWQGRQFESHVVPLKQKYQDVERIVGTIGVALDVTEQRQIRDEVNLARHIQEKLIPDKVPVCPGYDIAGAAFSAAKTCGDWFDFFRFADGRLGIVVGDVSGHGLGPAMLTTAANYSLRALARGSSDLCSILDATDEIVRPRMEEGRFVCTMLAALDTERAEIEYAGAGDDGAILNAGGGDHRVLASTGLPLGIDPDTHHEHAVTHALAPGDIVLLLTDGFFESFSPENEMFGRERVLATIQDCAELPAYEILNRLRRTVREFSGKSPQRDDMTGVVVKYSGTNCRGSSRV